MGSDAIDCQGILKRFVEGWGRFELCCLMGVDHEVNLWLMMFMKMGKGLMDKTNMVDRQG